jgi:HlyD family secretion protein
MSTLHDSGLPKSPHTAGDGPAPLLSQRVRALRLPESTHHRSGSSAWVAWLLCLGFAGSTAYLAYELYARPATIVATPAEKSDTASPTAGSTSVTVDRAKDGKFALQSKGYVIPARQILVSPKVSGMIQKLNVMEGLRVKKGDILAVLETTDYQSDVDRVGASLASAQQRLAELERGYRKEEKEQARAELAESEAQLSQLEADFKRAKDLREKNYKSQEEFDAAESKYRAMVKRTDRLRLASKLMDDGPRIERIEAARGDVAQFQAELVKAQWRLGNCTIAAPITGTILKKNAEEGNIVNPIAFNGSFSICEMADLSDLEVELSIQERDISAVFPGQKCKIEADAVPGRTFDGVVSRLMPIADRAKGSIQVRVKIAVPRDEEGILKPEMGVVVTFLHREGKP